MQLHEQSISSLGLPYPPLPNYSNEKFTYHALAGSCTVQALKQKIMGMPEDIWDASCRETCSITHAHVKTIYLLSPSNRPSTPLTYHEFYYLLQDDLRPILARIANAFPYPGTAYRIILNKLAAQRSVRYHRDGDIVNKRIHRVHVPLITNPGVIFTVGGEPRYLKEGELWEIDQTTLHGVVNHSLEDRVHLIVDWLSS